MGCESKRDINDKLQVWGLHNLWMLFVFTATLNTESNRFDGGEGVEINSWTLDVLIFPCLFGI